MRARSVYVDPRSVDALMGAIVAADARAADGTIALRKGTRIGHADRGALAKLDRGEIHIVDLDAGEIEQDEVADRLARAFAGPGTLVVPSSQGQARVKAVARGILRVRAEAVRAVNERPPLMLFTHLDGQAVAEDEEVAGVKSAALATPERLVAAVEAEMREAGPAVEVAAFRPRSVLLVVTERLEQRGREMVIGAVRRKLAWYGSTLARVAEVEHARGPVREALASAEVDLVLMSGANPLDPLDPALLALSDLRGGVVRSGVPAHPGSMVWTGRLNGGTAVIGVATCAGFGKDTALDVVLARVLADVPLETAVSTIGHGGLLEGPAGVARYPRYEA